MCRRVDAPAQGVSDQGVPGTQMEPHCHRLFPPTFENLRVSAVLFFFLSYYILFILCVYEGYMCMPHYAGGDQRATGM